MKPTIVMSNEERGLFSVGYEVQPCAWLWYYYGPWVNLCVCVCACVKITNKTPQNGTKYRRKMPSFHSDTTLFFLSAVQATCFGLINVGN